MRLISQVQSYRAGNPPFDNPYGAGFDLRTWWLAIDLATAPELITLARMLSTACPVAETIERCLEKAGWDSNPRARREELADAHSGMVNALRVFYEDKPPKYVPVRVCLCVWVLSAGGFVCLYVCLCGRVYITVCV